MLTLHRRLLALRRSSDALAVGSYVAVPADGDLLSYRRENSQQRFLVVLNLGHQPQSFALGTDAGRVVLSTHLNRDGEAVGGTLELRPDEGVVVELAQ